MATVSPPVNVMMIFTIQGDGSLRQMTGEIGPQGAAGLGSGTVCVVSSAGNISAAQAPAIIAAINSIGLPSPLGQRFVVDLALRTVNTF